MVDHVAEGRVEQDLRARPLVARVVARRGGQCAAGLLMERELKFLGEELEKPARPFVVILGGAKVSDKIQVIDRLLEKADALLIEARKAPSSFAELARKNSDDAGSAAQGGDLEKTKSAPVLGKQFTPLAVV